MEARFPVEGLGGLNFEIVCCLDKLDHFRSVTGGNLKVVALRPSDRFVEPSEAMILLSHHALACVCPLVQLLCCYGQLLCWEGANGPSSRVRSLSDVRAFLMLHSSMNSPHQPALIFTFLTWPHNTSPPRYCALHLQYVLPPSARIIRHSHFNLILHRKRQHDHKYHLPLSVATALRASCEGVNKSLVYSTSLETGAATERGKRTAS
jgi:hypothetical protein